MNIYWREDQEGNYVRRWDQLSSLQTPGQRLISTKGIKYKGYEVQRVLSTYRQISQTKPRFLLELKLIHECKQEEILQNVFLKMVSKDPPRKDKIKNAKIVKISK